MRCQYPENLRFTCLKCGLCCGDTAHKKRHILLLRIEAERIAAWTGQPISSFAKEAQQNAPYVFEMKKSRESGKCVFLRSETCTIYSQRPIICRFYPFEMRELEKGISVFRHTDECPGIGEGDILVGDYFKKLCRLASDSAESDRAFA
jgi:hypothetical protein